MNTPLFEPHPEHIWEPDDRKGGKGYVASSLETMRIIAYNKGAFFVVWSDIDWIT